MSLSSTRAALVAAVNDVDGVTGYPKPPSTWVPGDAWPTWGGADNPAEGAYATVFTQTWRVLVVLPAEQVDAEAWVDSHIDSLVAALAPVVAVTGYEPVALPANGTTNVAYYALRLTGETE